MGYQLATSIQDVHRFLEAYEGATEVGMDVEATCLDTRRAKLVGISIAPVQGTGIYMPVGHRIGTNVPMRAVIEALKEWLADRLAIFSGAKYDLNVLQKNTGWFPRKFEDTLELIYLENPDRKRKGIKLVAKEDCGFDMAKFESLFTPEEVRAKVLNIATKDPKRCVDYAVADSDGALRVWLDKQLTRREQDFAVRVDTKLIDIVRKIEHNGGMELNVAYIDEQIEALAARGDALRDQIHRMAGLQFEIDSPKQLGIALFDRMGIQHQGMTAAKINPIYKTDAKTLEKISNTNPIVEIVIAYRKVVKAKNTYFKKLKRLADLKIPVRFKFNIFQAPTFRFSAPGGDPTKDGATGINIQAVSNGEARDMVSVALASQGDQKEFEIADDELLVAPSSPKVDSGWKGNLADLAWTIEDEGEPPEQFCLRETCDGCPASCTARGIDVTRRMNKGLKIIPSVRQAFKSPEGWSLVSFDYDRQELVIGANLSKEPKWLAALAQKEDLHEVTAAAIYGMSLEQFKRLPKPERARKRHIAKTINFAVFYGATSYTLAMNANISQAAADQLFNTFVRDHPTLFNWINKVHLFARKNGYTTTYFGRKRSLKQFYDDDRRSMQAFADRSAVNTCIQGTAAEVTRIAMVKVAAALKRENITMRETKFALQLHDELMFLVRDDIIPVVVPLISKEMMFHVKSWTVQLTVSPKIGKVWGRQEETTVEKVLANAA